MFSSQIYCVTFVNHRCTGGFTYFALHFIHATFCIEPRTYENGQIVMTLPTRFSSEKLQTVDRRNGMSGYWTGTSDDADALVATLGDFFVFNGDKRVGRIAISNWSGKGSSAGKATLVSYQYADRPFTLTGSDKSYYYSNCSFNKGWNIFANINPASEGGSAKVLRTTTVPESTLFWRLAESYVYN